MSKFFDVFWIYLIFSRKSSVALIVIVFIFNTEVVLFYFLLMQLQTKCKAILNRTSRNIQSKVINSFNIELHKL